MNDLLCTPNYNEPIVSIYHSFESDIINPSEVNNRYVSNFNMKHKYFESRRLNNELHLNKKYKPKDLVINHKDGNRVNNSLINLELVTQSENTKHAENPKEN